MACLFLCLTFAAARAATITVNSAADSMANDGQCTLREAIIAANTNIPSGAATGECAAGASGLDTITFSIAGSGVRTIRPVSRMPTPTEALVIDGYTQPGASPNSLAVGNNAVLLIEIDGSGMTAFEPLFVLGPTSATTVRGLVVNRVPSTTFLIGPLFLGASSGNTIAGNFLGTDPAGTQLLDAGVGALISIETAQSRGNTIGGATPAARNVIVGGGTAGVGRIAIRSADNIVQGNYIGTNAAGTAAVLPVAPTYAITLQDATATGNLIGGPSAGMGNVIVATKEAISLSEASGNTIQGNFIGTNAAGLAALGGAGNSVGIATHSGATDNLIGGATAARGNVISGFRTGIRLQEGPLAIKIQGNRIGTDASGTLPIANINSGIAINAAGPGLIGGDGGAGEGNVIAFNGIGIVFETASANVGWSILGNSIAGNAGLGISFGAGAVPTPNDDLDEDTGANDLQNYPVLRSMTINSGNVSISGSLNSTPGTPFRVEFFSSIACDLSGYGEGRTYLGAINVGTDDSGNATFNNVMLPVLGGAVVTSTATRILDGTLPLFGSTSEFSACVSAPLPPSPIITKAFGSATIPLNATGVLTLSIANQAQASSALTGVAFNDMLPAGLVVATPNGLSTTCGSGTITAVAGGGVVNLSGATLAPGSSCTIGVNVIGTTGGVKNNSVTVRANESGAGNTSTASVTVVLPPIIVNVFGVPSLVMGATTTLTFSLTNPNASTTLTGIAFIDVLNGVVVATPNRLVDGCDGGVISANSGSNTVSLSGATLGPGESCVFALDVTAIAQGPLTDSTGVVTSIEGGAGAPALAGLVVTAEPAEIIPTLQGWGLLILATLLLLGAMAASRR